MATYGNIIDRVLENVGNPAASATIRARILKDIENLVEVELASAVGGPFIQGSVSLSVDGTASDGVYTLPATLRGFELPLILDGERIEPRYIFSDPDLFWSRHDTDDTNNGEPSEFLIYEKQITLRPIPTTSHTIELFGTIYKVETMLETTNVPHREYEPALEYGATSVHASRTKQDDVANTYEQRFQRSLSLLRMGRATWRRRAAGWRGYL